MVGLRIPRKIGKNICYILHKKKKKKVSREKMREKEYLRHINNIFTYN